ncbi:MAG: hypothetical protein KY475_27230, partial [Planctomycetes bacterium]|nr:hypothetical protein [Planctomycetota bacterium]
VVLLALAWPIYRALVETKQSDPRLYRLASWLRRRFESGKDDREAPDLAKDIELARRRSLRLAFYAATIGMGLWIAAGALYPLMLPLSWNQAFHFALSLIVCGLIVSVYPFFGTAYVGVRVFYPALLTVSPAQPHEARELNRLVRETGVMLVMTVAVPSVGGLMLYVGQKLGLDNFLVDLSLGLLFVLGLVGIFVAFYMHQRIRQDVEALIEAAQPTDTHISRSTSIVSKTAG